MSTGKSAPRGERASASKKDREHIENLKLLAFLVKEIVRDGTPKQKGSKNTTVNPVIKAADHIIKGLEAANCKVVFYLKAYQTQYPEMRKSLLKSYESPDWMCKTIVKMHLGDPKIGAYLHISLAMNTAIKLRNSIINKDYSNPNDREEAMMHYHCYYPALLHYRFLTVMLDALGEDHADAEKIRELISSFKEDAGFNRSDSSSSSSSGDESEEGDDIAKSFKGLTGEKKSVKDIEKTVTGIMGNKDALNKVKDVFTKASTSEGNPLDNKELLTETVSAVAPMFNDMFANITGGKQQKGKKPAVSSSSSESD